MATFTNEQMQLFKFEVADGLGRKKPIEDGSFVAVSSDETVVSVGGAVKDDAGAYTFSVEGVAPGSARVVATGDADLGEGVNTVTGTVDVEVTLDPRTGMRMVTLTAVGEPQDKAV